MAKESIPTLAEYNNNPGNLKPPRDVVYPGQLGLDENGFAIFENKDFGRKALVNDIRYKLKNGLMTPEAFIDKYAPAGDENSEDSRDNYKLHITHNLGLKSSKDEFPEGSEEKIADLITSFETGSPYAPKETTEGTAPTPVSGTTSKDRDINPIYGGIAGGVAGVGLATPIATYKSYYDLARSAANMMPRYEPTMAIEPTLESNDGAWGKKTGYGLGEGSTREQSQRYQRAMPKGKLSRAYVERLGGTSAMRQTAAQAQAEAQALAEANALAQQQVARTQGPVRSALGQLAGNFMIPVKAGLAGFGTGFGALDAYNRAKAGDTSGSVAAGTGALASALSPFVAGAGPLSMAIPIGLYARDKMTRMTPEQSRARDEEIKRLGYDPSFNP